jgi:hypothetical protein
MMVRVILGPSRMVTFYWHTAMEMVRSTNTETIITLVSHADSNTEAKTIVESGASTSSPWTCSSTPSRAWSRPRRRRPARTRSWSTPGPNPLIWEDVMFDHTAWLDRTSRTQPHPLVDVGAFADDHIILDGDSPTLPCAVYAFAVHLICPSATLSGRRYQIPMGMVYPDGSQDSGQRV